ncbi:pilus assembly PilX family protein [Stutzerimonas tarimensis]|uniref:PilX N-terminal domain-containing pilus assembly protein n=1 Tax=Stutzerimonas tarimensis TaxID=1507735 RepID=A0ABV7T916_9GAMM
MMGRSYQEGSTLIVCLVFLLILTLIGLNSIQTSTLQEQMAGAARDFNSAFQAAELGLRGGESYLELASLGGFDGSGGRYMVCANPDSTATQCVIPSWKTRSSTGWVVLEEVNGISAQPQYIIEKFRGYEDMDAPLDADVAKRKIEVYRITARGFGVSDHSMVVLQSTFRRG